MSVQLAEGIVFPRDAVRFPVELRQSPQSRPDDPETWPKVTGRLEHVGGRLLYMPPCADYQQDTASDVTFVLREWREGHPDYLVGSNEAGMLLGGDLRAADVAVWRAADARERTGKVRRRPPVLAVEIAGEDEGEEPLREKAAWYLDNGVSVVWLVFPHTKDVLVLAAGAEARHGRGGRLPEHPELPGLSPMVDRLFAQLE